MWSERIYDSLPIALQNAAVSLRGWQYHWARYLSPSFQETARVLERNEVRSSAALKALQFCMFRAFAAHAYEHSPYYRALWDSQRLRPEDIRHPSDIRSVPIVPKQDLRARTGEFFTEKINRSMTPAHTSGTTGSPLTVYFSQEDIGRRHAFLERCRRWAGVSIGQKRATFTGRNIIPQTQQRPPFWRYNYSGKQLLFSAYHLSPQNLAAYVEALGEFQPAIIDGYPSAIHIVADHILRDVRVRSVNPRAILVSAETVLPRQRATIETAFATKLYNQYASSEGAPFVSECRGGRLHVHSDSGLVEILDAENNPAAPGQMGQMVVTSFTTHVAPLVRFAIGDIAIQSSSEEPCQCGLAFPTIEAIVGREDDVLFTPDRGYVGRLDTVFKSAAHTIIEAQIVQTSPESILLRVVPDRSRYNSRDAEKIVEEMRKRLGHIVRIGVEEVQSIPRSANGKMRPVVNLCQGLLPNHLRSNSDAGASSPAVQEHTAVS